MRRPSGGVSSAALLLACVLALRFRAEAAAGTAAGISACLNSLVPSLFPFVVLACALSSGGAAAVLFRPLGPVMRRVFRLPEAAAPALVFGLLAGYPAGARIAASLRDTDALSEKDAARLMLFCTAPGLAFTLSFVGPLFGGGPRGPLLLAATSLPPLLFGAVLARFAPPVPKTPLATRADPSGGFTEAVRGGASAMMTLCAFVVAFSAASAVLRAAGVFRFLTGALARCGVPAGLADPLLTGFLEVTAGVGAASYWHLSPAAAAFLLGFGGLCIHAQLFAFFGSRPPCRRTVYLASRVLNGVLCAAAYRLLAPFFPAAQTAAAMTPALSAAPAAGTWPAAAALIGASLVFLAGFSGGKNADPPFAPRAFRARENKNAARAERSSG